MNADLRGAHWFKSSYSAGGTECVEIAHLNHGHVGVRDSKNPTGPALVFAPTAWDRFTSALRSGVFA
ncbi:DUF397 domain-containing protein [Nocardia cyriacigeorgica]|uniref:DUF397 domain-containing protein n=1 Tax=Nocardia cyriacigeorgica TaxID=135487 RepID=A0A5R8NGQ5_9NOCA|nr:DUF397 domain-containing protein [Nocardia cyriacigeorgica]TLF74868.1 DUF397 domain-containing protein [Nocardia cyriacigeorgica]